MLIVGLTGGISSGKSTVSNWFVEKGITVLDADAIVRKLQSPHSELVKTLAKTFGHHIMNDDGSLNRGELGQLIFSSEEAKVKINEIIHPRVKQELLNGIQKAQLNKEPFIILDVPLLYESNFTELVNLVVVVYVSNNIQLQRLMKRDQIDRGYAVKKISSQLSLEKKRELADLILNNDGDLNALREQFETVYEQILNQANKVSLKK